MKTKKYQIEVDVPVLDLSRGAVLEVLEGGQGDILLNGTLLKGAMLTGYYQSGQSMKAESNVLLPNGEQLKMTCLLVVTRGSAPTRIPE